MIGPYQQTAPGRGGRRYSPVSARRRGTVSRWLITTNKAGFSNIQKKTIKTPIGRWPADKKWKEVRQFNRLALKTGLEGFSLYILTNTIGWEYEDVQI
ncbi:unnamed protein product [Clonostachys rosea f. rosea IK726]|uniref:Uncharacterized protein n=2 Tax=Bionectria ochroleuca TaxID=29856 RepID=A0A0B7KPV6_BIOOC|nr:unnamed protein product [Clonostachys rosea f. rosea IK726]